MKEYYNVMFYPTDAEQPDYGNAGPDHATTKVLVHASLQHIHSERILQIGPSTMRRIRKLENGRTGYWIACAPTPYGPTIIWR